MSGIEEVITLFFVSCLLYKAVFCLPNFGLGYVKYMENKCQRIQYCLGCSPDYAYILCLWISFVSVPLLRVQQNHRKHNSSSPQPGVCEIANDACLLVRAFLLESEKWLASYLGVVQWLQSYLKLSTRDFEPLSEILKWIVIPVSWFPQTPYRGS